VSDGEPSRVSDRVTMAEANWQGEKIFGLVAVAIGTMLVLGATMFSLVLWLTPAGKPVPFPITPAYIQIALGALAVVAGLFLIRGYSKSKFVLIVIAIGVVVNLGYLIVSALIH
jgi:hypothetical protein